MPRHCFPHTALSWPYEGSGSMHFTENVIGARSSPVLTGWCVCSKMDARRMGSSMSRGDDCTQAYRRQRQFRSIEARAVVRREEALWEDPVRRNVLWSRIRLAEAMAHIPQSLSSGSSR